MPDLYVRSRSFVLPLLAILCMAVTTPQAARPADAASDPSAEPILEAAQRFVELLTPEQRDRAVMPFADERREDWHYIPKPQRKGLALKDMTAEQMHMAHVLLSASLSQRGYAKATTIMSLDALLKQLDVTIHGQGVQLAELAIPGLELVRYDDFDHNSISA